LDFFGPTDWRYEYRLKEERKKTAARRSPQSGCDLFDSGFALFEGLRYPGIGSLSEYEPILKLVFDSLEQ
jgi:hypothetical protein